MVLVDVDEQILEELVAAATSEASAAEVTAPVTPGEQWTTARVDWLREFHRARRAGLGRSTGEATWAIVAGDEVVGSARLKRTGEPGVLETGLWLTRRARGRGIGSAAVALVLDRANAVGASAVCATTTAGNAAALAVLRRLGFTLSEAPDGPGVEARYQLDQPR